MAIPLIQHSVNAGEFSPALYGRTDLQKYRAGCSTLRNMFPAVGGGASSRAGTLFVGLSRQTDANYPPQLIPFQYSVTQGYCLVFSNHEMSVVKNGAYVVNQTYTCSSASTSTSAVFTATGNNFVTGSWVFATNFVDAGFKLLNGQFWSVSSIPSTGTFTLQSIYTGAAVNSTTYSSYTTGGDFASLFILTTPYASADLQALKWAESADVLTITHPSYAPADIARIADNNWTLTTTSFSASISPPTTLSGNGTSFSVTQSQNTQYAYVVTAINSADGQESIASSPVVINNSVNISVNLGSIAINWTQVTGASYYNVYKAIPTVGTAIPAGALYGFAGSAFGLSFVDTNIQQDFNTTPPLHQNPFAPGAIQYITVVSGGTTYSAYLPPTVTITDGTGTGATAYAIVVGSTVQGIVLTNGGQNYSPTPTVTITVSAAGSGFAATAVTNGHGTWDGGGTAEGTVTISSGGSGYTAGTIVTATYPIYGSTVTQIATSLTVAGGAITAIEFPYTVEGQKPVYSAVTISVPAGSGATATATVGPTTGTYPSVVGYFQDRRFYANTVNQPDTYFGSQPGAFKNMDRSIPTVASDAIIGSPWAQQVNGISDLVPMPGGLVMLTGQGAWQLNGGQRYSALTPIDQQATAQAYNGISPLVKAIPINFDILYVQEKGSIVRDLGYDIFRDIYTGTDLTVMSAHLFTGRTIERWAWAEEPYKLIWAVRDDGQLLSLTFLKEQDIWAWARHDTNGLFESVAVVTEPPVDAPYFVTKRSTRS